MPLINPQSISDNIFFDSLLTEDTMHHPTEAILQTLVAAVFLGILAQIIAHRWRLPAILPLLILGMLCGPSGLSLFDPGALGHTLEVVVHLGVAIILFEGGLSLKLEQLRQVGTSLRNLLSIGTLVTWVGAAWLANFFTGIAWPTAALFGAIVTVTGPTVVAPLLRHLVAPKRARTLLLSEGLMIDPIGAVLAYFVLQWIERSGLHWQALSVDLLHLAATGAILGFAAGIVAVFAMRSRKLGDELRNLVTLALLLGCFLLAELQSPQSGILASMVMGLTVSGTASSDLHPLKSFKGQLTVLVISILFILLSGQLDLESIGRLGMAGALVVAGLILIVRPLAVFLSIPPSALSIRERLLLGLTAPRGIVAAAVASLSAIQLRAEGMDQDAATLEGLVYLVIIVTCTFSTVLAPVLPRWLGFTDDPSRRRVILVGAHTFSVHMARILGAEGWQAVVIDGVSRKLSGVRAERIVAVAGDARDAETYDRAGVERDTEVLALTANDELNLLVAELVRNEFGVEHPVVGLQNPPEELGSQRLPWIDLLGQGNLNLPKWSQLLSEGKAWLTTLELTPLQTAELADVLRENASQAVLICGWRADGRPVFHLSATPLKDFKKLTLLCRFDIEERLQSHMAARPEPLQTSPSSSTIEMPAPIDSVGEDSGVAEDLSDDQPKDPSSP